MDLTQYLQIPYKEDGRGINGVDCYGIVVLFYHNEFGLNIKQFDKKEDFDAHKEDEFVKVDSPSYGDCILISNNGATIDHIGIYINSRYFLHTNKMGTHLGKIRVWQKRFKGFYKHRSFQCA